MMVGHPTPAMVSITGSVRAGRQVAAGAAPRLKRVHLELGGKAPVVVFADADLATAAADIAVAGFFNAVCMRTACPLHAHCMCTACALHVHCMCTAYFNTVAALDSDPDSS